jgi:hypothetical protein
MKIEIDTDNVVKYLKGLPKMAVILTLIALKGWSYVWDGTFIPHGTTVGQTDRMMMVILISLIISIFSTILWISWNDHRNRYY